MNLGRIVLIVSTLGAIFGFVPWWPNWAIVFPVCVAISAIGDWAEDKL